jgi:iron complex outermembrane recepter protein
MSSFPAGRAAALMLAAVLAFGTGTASALAAQTPTVLAGTVSNAVTGAPVVNATVRVALSPSTYLTGTDGRYRLVVPPRATELRVTAIGFAPLVRSVVPDSAGETTVDVQLEPTPFPLAEVLAIGARTGDRTVTESPVPADMVSAELLENTGAIETWQQLRRVVPSVATPHIPLGDNHARPVTLRGLAPHHVLVLVNGKRRHPASVLLAGPAVTSAAFTDLNAIPGIAIDRIEVLRDGAAAQYGSDAVAGVINVVTKSGSRSEVSASWGSIYSDEGGRDWRDGRTYDLSASVGASTPGGGHVTLSGELRDRQGTNRAYPDLRPQYFSGDPRNDAPPRISSWWGDGSARDVRLLLSLATPLSSAVELYGFAGASDRDAAAPDAFFRRPLDPRTVRTVHPDGFLPDVVSHIGDLSTFAGARGLFGAWSWDLSSGWGANRVAYKVLNSNNASLGGDSPIDFRAGSVAAGQWTTNVDISRAVRLFALPVSVAAGVELRVDRYSIEAGEPDSWRDGGVPILDGPLGGQPAAAGAQGMVGFRPVDEVSARRTSSALYLEIESRPWDRLLVQAAARTERYSDFGSTLDGKLAAHARVGGGVAVRAAVSTGFRAPALTQQYYSRTNTILLPVDGVTRVLTSRTFPVHTDEARLLGAEPLRPEQAISRSAGVVFDRPGWPVVTVDYYHITVNDRIGLRGAVTDTSIVRLFEENGMAGVGGGSYFSNDLDVRTSGFDVVASHAFLLGRSALRVTAGYNRTESTVLRVADPPPELAQFADALFNRTSRGIIEQGQPGRTFLATVNFSTGPLELNLHNQRSGPTAQLDRTNPAADQVVEARWVTDLRVAYRMRERVQVSVSALNLFDAYPTEWWDFKDGPNATGASVQGNFRYPGALSAFGMNGRAVYLQLSYR